MFARLLRNLIITIVILFFAIGSALAQSNGNGNSNSNNGNGNGNPPAEAEEPAPAEDSDPDEIDIGGIEAAASQGGGGDPTEYESELGIENLNKLNLSDEITPETTDLLGESVDLNTGGISFSYTDVSLPGNSALEVAVHRRFKGKTAYAWQDTHQFENWLLDIPHIHTNQVLGLGGYSGPWAQGMECRGAMTSGVMLYQGQYFSQDMWWTGDTLNVPGKAGDKLLLNINTAVIADGSYPKVTASNWRISCFDRYEDGVIVGDGFTAESPDGQTYTFDKFRRVQTTWAGMMPRYDTYMLVTRVEDQFGNWVNYNYTGDNLMSIEANDGRIITFYYENPSRPHRITKISANGRDWTYGYTGDTYLTSVTRPDGKSWAYGLNYMNYTNLPQTDRYCNANGSATANLTIEHPNGATGTFTVTATKHGRSNVPDKLFLVAGDKLMSKCFWTFAVTKKVLTGPGLPTMQWDYSYSQNNGSFVGETAVGVSYSEPLPATVDYRNSKRTDVVAPDGSKTVYFFNRDYSSTLEGKQTAVDYFDTDGTTLLKRVESTFQQQGNRLGFTQIDDDNVFPHDYRVNLTKSETYLYNAGGTDKYTKEYSQYDVHGVPDKIYEYNNFSTNQRYTLNGYRDGTTAWILNQPTTVGISASDSNYTTVSETTYDGSDRPYESRRFGRWFKRNTSWHSDGNVKRTTYNATNRWVETLNHKRGIAQTIKTPQSLTTSPQYAYRVVDNNGWITKTTDFEGNVVDYEYDGLGRRELVDPADSKWANTVISYPTTTAGEASGLAYVNEDMPKKVLTRGSYEQTIYFDALLRPVLTVSKDTASSESRYVRTAHNTYGNLVFQSYRVASAANTSDTADGTETTYDGIQRAIEVDENTVSGSVTTAYLDDNEIQINDNKGNVTTTTFLAYGSPSMDSPTLIAQPEGVSTSMVYNIFGNMTLATQGGFTQHNVYDSYQNPCKIVRLDSGNEAFVIDAVGQTSWSARGGSVSGSTTSCDTSVSSSDKITYTYDNLGNIKLVNYGDASPDITSVYDKNSNVLSLGAGSVVTTYAYNSARLLSSETLEVDSETFDLEYDYDALGNLDSLTYPSAVVVDFDPNAFGEATKAGPYASSIGYHPNGSIATLTYGTQHGSGRIYTTTQNARQLPAELKIVLNGSNIAKYIHTYDSNYNITFIDDAVNGSSYDRTMTYDGLDRLKTAAGYWGSGSYTYDALGNIKSKIEGSTYYYYSYDGNNRLYYVYGPGTGYVTYDARGNVTSHRGHSYTYNLAGNMISSTSPTITYAYDGHKRRVKKTEGGQTSYSMYSLGGKMLHKKVGGVTTDYIYAGGLLVAEKTGSTVDYMHTDLLGSPIAGSNGTAYKEHYRPWGEKKDHPVQLANDVGYTGHQDDVATGLTYMQARYYDPVIGRFMAVDPVGFTAGNPMSFGRYTYVNNNPLKFTDPTGQFCIPCLGAAIGGTAYVVSKLIAGEDPTLAGLAASAAAGAVGGLAIGAASSAGIATITAGTTFAETGVGVAAGLVTETAIIATVSGATAVAGNTALNIVESFEATGVAPTHPLAGAETSFVIGAVLGQSGDELASSAGRVVGRGVAGISPASAPAASQLTEIAVETGVVSGGEVLYNETSDYTYRAD